MLSDQKLLHGKARSRSPPSIVHDLKEDGESQLLCPSERHLVRYAVTRQEGGFELALSAPCTRRAVPGC
eukprot:3231818-Pleurochrysis_carterae.AAC.3